MTEWVKEDGLDPLSVAKILFRIRLIGLSKSSRDPTYYCNGQSFSQIWGRVSPAPVVHIHPAFRKVLDVAGGVTSRPWRVKRARRVDSRQLTFEESS